MRRVRPGTIAALVCFVVIVAGVVVYDGGHHRLGGAILAVALLGLGLVIGPGFSTAGRGAEAEGIQGRRQGVTGFDRPDDQSGI
jgi:hypothetical protein